MRTALAALIALVLLMPATASAATYAGQAPVGTGVDEVIDLSLAFWASHGVRGCNNVIRAWQAPDLTDGDGIYAAGRGMECEIWVHDEIADAAYYPAFLSASGNACAVIGHEVGHALGLEHDAGGLMGPIERPPAYCRRWAKEALTWTLDERWSDRRKTRWANAQAKLLWG